MAFGGPKIVGRDTPDPQNRAAAGPYRPPTGPIKAADEAPFRPTTTTTVPPPLGPAQAEGATGTGVGSGTAGGAGGDLSVSLDEFERLNAESLESALLAIEAQFGLTREQLLAERSAVGDEYRYLAAQAERAREFAKESAVQGAQERGIGRSGIAVEAVSDVEQQYADQFAQLEANRTSQFEGIDSQLAGLEQQEELARLEQERASEQALLDLEIMQLLADAGL